MTTEEIWVEGISPSGTWVRVEQVSQEEADNIALVRDPRKYRIVHTVQKISWGGLPFV